MSVAFAPGINQPLLPRGSPWRTQPQRCAIRLNDRSFVTEPRRFRACREKAAIYLSGLRLPISNSALARGHWQMAFSNIKTKRESGMRIEELTKQNDELVSEAASILHDYSEELAAAWMAKPFARVNMATAFATGFLNGRDPSDTDPHLHALLVMDVAMQDQRHRKLCADINDNHRG